MFFFDLHCDTVTEANDKGRGFLNDCLHVSLDRLSGEQWCQCFAIFIPDKLRGQAAVAHFERNLRFYRAQANLHVSRMQKVRTTAEIETAIQAGRVACMLTVEGGAVLAGDIGNVKKLAAAGVRMLTLTWNGVNEIGSGTATDQGISFFGRMVGGVLEQNGIIIDVSHLNETGFWELSKFTKRPFVASHSNSRAVYDHPRNLTDDQFRHIVSIGGIVGLNLYPDFVNGREDYDFGDLARHVEHFLSLGGEHAVAMGCDFDGAEMPSWILGMQSIPMLYDMMTDAFGKEQTDLLFGKNAMTFLRRYEALDLLLGALRE